MVVTSRRRGWTQETRCYSHLEQTRPTRRVVTLIWSRQAFEVLLIGSGDGSSRISASACERWQKGVGHTTTGLSHSLWVLVVLGCGWGAADRPLGSAVRMCERSKKTDPLLALATRLYHTQRASRDTYRKQKKICLKYGTLSSSCRSPLSALA